MIEVYFSEDGFVRKVRFFVILFGIKKFFERFIYKLILIYRLNEDESDV